MICGFLDTKLMRYYKKKEKDDNYGKDKNG